MKEKWLIFGVHSTQSKEILDFIKQQKITPILGETDPHNLLKLCYLKKRSGPLINLDRDKYTDLILKDVNFVLDCNTDYNKQSQKIFMYCLYTKTPYINLSKSYRMFEYCYKISHKNFLTKSSFLLGIQIDTIVFDLIASQLKRILPDATSIKLAYNKDTFLYSENHKKRLQTNTIQRVNGLLKKPYFLPKLVLIAYQSKLELSKMIDHPAVSMVWKSTKIPSIQVFRKTTLKEMTIFRLLSLIRICFYIPFLGKKIKHNFLFFISKKAPKNKKDDSLYFWGTAKNAKNQIVWLKVAIKYNKKKYYLLLLNIINTLKLSKKIGYCVSPSDLFDLELLNHFDGVNIASSIDKVEVS